jgi:hypothetical protein
VIVPLRFERLHERGAALGAWLDAGLDLERLLRLDRRVRAARVTDWPGRRPGPEPRAGDASGGLQPLAP